MNFTAIEGLVPYYYNGTAARSKLWNYLDFFGGFVWKL